jgi:PAS domain S-box-containing protein
VNLRARAITWTAGESRVSLRYVWASVLALAAAIVMAAFGPWLEMPLLLVCVGAVAIAAAFGGAGPGLLTAAMTGSWAAVFPPRSSRLQYAAPLAAFVVVSAVVALAAGWSRGAFLAVLARRRTTARSIRARLGLLRAITRAVDEGVCAVDASGRITYLNAAAERMLGFRSSELLGFGFPEAVRCRRSVGSCSGQVCCLLQVIATGHPVRGKDDLLTRKDGSCFPVSYGSAPLVRGGKIVGAVVAFRDVTEERRQIERERFLADATRALSSSIDFEETVARVVRLAMPFLGEWSMVVLLDEHGAPRRIAVEASNPAHAETSREMLRSYPIDLEAEHGAGRVLRTREPELLPEVSDLAGRRGSTVRERGELLRRLGLRSFMAVPLRARDRVIGVLDFGLIEPGRRFDEDDLALATELAGRCALAIDNARLHRRAQDAVRAREDMLAIVSHDLRNPIHSVRIAASIVEKAAAGRARPDAASRAAAAIVRASERMARLIGDLVDLGSIDAGRLSIEQGVLSAREVVEEAIEAVRPAAAEAGLELSSRPAQQPLFVLGDHVRLHQLLVNLLSNAVKVTPAGGRVWVQQRARGESAVISVCDTGPGISREQRRKVFDAYWRGAGVCYAGTGLGLSIAKGIAEAHRGRLWVVSRPGRGASFRFSLPRARDAGRGEASPLAISAAAGQAAHEAG